MKIFFYIAFVVSFKSTLALGLDSPKIDFESISQTQTHLPVVHIQSHVSYPDLTKEVRENATVDIYGHHLGGYENHYFFEKPIASHNAKVRLRGNTSLLYDKRQFSIKFTDANFDEDKRVSISNLGTSEKWVLHASAADKSFMRHVLGFEIARMAGLPAPNWRYVEVVFNQEYLGVYILTENPDEDISDLSHLDKKENGGFLLKVDSGKPDENFEPSPTSKEIELPVTKWRVEQSYPNPEKEENFKYRESIESLLNAAERSLYSENFDLPFEDTGAPEYAKYFNVEAFAKYILLRELLKDLDGFKRSIYFVKDNDGKLSIGPVWDFDAAAGGLSVLLVYQYPGTQDWSVAQNVPFNVVKFFPWFKRLFESKYFAYQVNAIWNEWSTTFLKLEDVPESKKNRCIVPHIAPWVHGFVNQRYIELTHGCSNMDKTVKNADGHCPIRRNFTKWVELGKPSSRDEPWYKNTIWRDAPLYQPRRVRQYDRLTNSCGPEVQDINRYSKVYGDLGVSLVWWMSDRIDWINEHSDEFYDID